MTDDCATSDDFIIANTASLLGLLDFSIPALAPVQSALAEGDTNAAGDLYISYFRQKEIACPLWPDWFFAEDDPSYDTTQADLILDGHLRDGYSVYERPETGIDWHNTPLSCITRFPLLHSVQPAFHHTGATKYLQFIVEHIMDYMQAYPIEEFAGKSSRSGWIDHTHVAKPWYWCMVPNRLLQWAPAIDIIRGHPEVSSSDLLAMLQRMHEETAYQCTQMRAWVDKRHNAGGAMIEAVLRACAILADFNAANTWLDLCSALQAQYIETSFYPDGVFKELTVAYGESCAVRAQIIAHMLRDRPQIEPARQRVAAMVTATAALSKPTRRMPSFGDLYPRLFPAVIYGPALEWVDRPWAKSIIRPGDGPSPPFTVWPEPGDDAWCGYYTMRSDWAADALYMAIDGGPWGINHQHADKLSFVLSAYGTDFIIDPSSTLYASNVPDAFVSVQRAGFLHSTITVDGVDEFRNSPVETETPLTNTWEHGDDYSLFVGTYSFEPVKPVKWERRILFVDNSYWLIQDVLTGDLDTVSIEQNFPFDAEIEVAFNDMQTTATAPNGARLTLTPLSGALTPELTIGDKTPHTTYGPHGKPTTVLASSDGKDQQHGRGWVGRCGDKLIPAPAVTYTGPVTLPAMITTAIVPLKPGNSPADGPAISSERAAAKTNWLLPAKSGTLEWQTSIEECNMVSRR